MTDAPTSLRILRAKEVDHLTGTHESQRYRLEAVRQFPRRVKIAQPMAYAGRQASLVGFDLVAQCYATFG